jgi:hypothetical protein
VSSRDPFAAELAEMARERELDAIAAHPRRRARPVAPATAAPTPSALMLTPIGDLLNEPDERVDWLVDGIVPAGGIVVCAGKPKAGKSTAIRCMGLGIARGGSFLGRACTQGTVWYLALEGRRRDIRDHFRRMGARASDDLRVFVGQAPRDIVTQVEQLAARERPAAIIVDTMQRFLRAESTDDYAEMTTLFDSIIGIAQRSGAAIVLLHHAGKVDRPTIDAVLGSTAITGSAETIILISRTDRYRTISTVQRTGDDLPETVILLDDETGAVRLGGSRADADRDATATTLLEALQTAGQPLTREEWFERVEGRRTVLTIALRALESRNKIHRSGSGTRNSPYRYAAIESVSCSLVPSIDREQETKLLLQSRSTESVSCSLVPTQEADREQVFAWPTIWTHQGCYCAVLGADAPCAYCDGPDRRAVS